MENVCYLFMIQCTSTSLGPAHGPFDSDAFAPSEVPAETKLLSAGVEPAKCRSGDGVLSLLNPPLLKQREIIEIDAQPNDRISTAPQLSRRLLCAGWFLCFLRPRVLERDRPVESEALRRTVFVQGEVAEALKLILGFASRLPQAWLASSCNDFE